MSESMAYAGYCPDCGNMVAACVDEIDPKPKGLVRKQVASFMRDGLNVSRVTCQNVRDSLFGCTDSCGCRFCVKERRRSAPPLTGTPNE